ncbi:hypothetical protein AKJ37_05400 [candidate division MSBL1 archaeon SCGC-AAA259I09]|uniref:PRC-barrel domain-containing protein n=1 Tax=candidate division MSBL1 archaeon SCGC-AAA259I09 TaxID=1698267 RepID=A0A133UQ44_9EURY|nr:hypothetical protein AKJ37_05400 [candidate division MSBL1 archaeon SCGC-AAA259I09]
MKVSEYYELPIYSDKGNYIGEVEKVMLDPEKEKVAGLVFEKRGEKYKAVPYHSVTAVGDVVIARSGRKSPPGRETEEEEPGIGKTIEKESEGE